MRLKGDRGGWSAVVALVFHGGGEYPDLALVRWTINKVGVRQKVVGLDALEVVDG